MSARNKADATDLHRPPEKNLKAECNYFRYPKIISSHGFVYRGDGSFQVTDLCNTVILSGVHIISYHQNILIMVF